MADIGTLIMKIQADTKKFNKGMAGVQKTVKDTAKVVGVASLAIAGVLGTAGVKAIQFGADAEEMRNKYDVVFKGMTDTVDEWSEDFARSVGRSKFDIQESVSNLADLQQGLGMTKEESFGLSAQIVELATDLASFNNVQDEQAIDAVAKAMLGEAESAKQLGLLLNVDRVKDYAEAQGLVYEELTDAEKAQQVYNLAVEQSQNAIGDAERSSESFTNQMKALKSGVKDATTEIGMELLPIATEFVQYVNQQIVPRISDWIEKGKELGSNIKEFLMPIIENISNFIVENYPMMRDTAVDAFLFIQEKAMALWTFFKDNFLPIITDIYNMIRDNWPLIKDTATSVFNDVLTVVTSLWEFFDKNLMPIIKEVVSTAKEEFPEFLQAVKDTFGAAAIIIKTVVDTLQDAIDLYDKFNEALPEHVQTKSGLGGILQEAAGLLFPTNQPGAPIVDFDTISGQKAQGGRVQAGKSYLVNEGNSGGEIFTPSSNGMISPMGHGGITININGITDPDEVGRAVVRELAIQGVA